jgi:hypothetical protein
VIWESDRQGSGSEGGGSDIERPGWRESGRVGREMGGEMSANSGAEGRREWLAWLW